MRPAKHRPERNLAEGDARFRQMFMSSAVGMLITDLAGTVIEANDAMLDVLGCPDGLAGTRLADVLHPEETATLSAKYRGLVDDDTGSLCERTRMRKPDGDTVWVRLSASLLLDSAGRPDSYATTVEDISDLHLLEHQLGYQGTHDALTGLANRSTFVGKLEEALAGAAGTSVLHLNLDAFSVINYGHGWHVGDTLLQVVAGKLTVMVAGKRACVARFGVDEFAVLIAHGPTPPDMTALACAINAELAEPTYVDGHGVAASATIAVARDIAPETDPAELLCTTGIALRELKSRGRGQWGLVDPAMDKERRAHYRLAASIPGAWESGELAVDHRPIMSLADRRPVTMQASLRWNHQELGVLDHRTCQRAIADTGFGLRIGQWALNQAALPMAADDAFGRLYLELTREQAVDPDLVAVVRGVLTETGLPAERLDLGFPVVALEVKDRPAEDSIGVLAELGVGVVLYGYGAASRDLTYLKSLPLRAVRLAGAVASWVTEHATSGLPGVLAARGLVPLVRASGLSMIVGGLRTEDQAKWWSEVGVDLGEGPLFGGAGPLRSRPGSR
jgi:diguanylate cyclase (GGDEF)-like protein/PAS domain S-box-containing protein